MKKTLLTTLFAIITVAMLAVCLVSCNGNVKFDVNFVVDGEIYDTVSTSGSETIEMPQNPTKEGYVFDGWYWDKDTWEKPFTASSLLDAPLSSDMSVYAKWKGENEKTLYTVSFETNGGTVVQSIKQEVIQTAPVTTKDYNTFVGWYSDPTLQESTKISFPYTPTANVTLYAKWSVNFTEGLQLTLQTTTNTYAVTGYTGTESVIIIPAEYKGLDVTAINARAFEGNTMITDVTIPNSVITIGLGAFSECYNIETVDMSDQLQILGASAFSNCTKLVSVDLPNTLINIGGEAFFGCMKLKELYLSNELENIGTNIIRGCNSLEKLTLPGRITLISLVGDAIENIPSTLSEIIVANGSESVCNRMLYNCDFVKKLTVPDSVNSIGESAFEGCLIENVTIPTVVIPHLPKTALKTATITSGNSIENNAFKNSSNLVSVSIPNSVTSIGSSAFSDCTSLTNITIPNSVTSIGISAFSDCTSLTSITIPNSVTSIGDEAFRGCDSLTSITIPNSVTSIGNRAFRNCTSLTSVTIPNSVTSIGTGAFYNCTRLTSVTIPNSVTSIGSGAFNGCTSLESITLPFVGATKDGTSNTLFGYIFGASSNSNNANSVPSSLKTVVITGGTRIDNYAFRNCTSLTSVTIPSSVTSIGNYAFEGCTSLTSITVDKNNTAYCDIDGNLYNKDGKTLIQYAIGKKDTSFSVPNCVTSIGSGAFNGCTSLTSITIPSSVTSISSFAFSNCTSLTSVTIPNSVTSIGSGAFNGCTSLESITLPFVGASKSATSASDSTLFGYIFGTSSYTGGVATEQYYKSVSYATYYIPSSLKTVTVTEGNILYGAFYNCSGLTSITIPNSVTSIGEDAFRDCTSLTAVYITDIAAWCNIEFASSTANPLYYANNLYLNGELVTNLVIPDGVTEIKGMAFYDCSSLTSVTIPNSVTSIGEDAFYRCTSLTSVYITDIAAWCNISFAGYYATPLCYANNLYLNGELVTNLVIPEGVTEIKNFAFSGYESLKSITIPSSVTTIGNYAFYWCSSLESITLPFVGATKDGTSNTHFGYIFGASSYSYNDDYVPASLKTVVITGGTSIGNYAFYNCFSLTSVTIPNSVTSIGYGAFYGCDSLTSVTIPNSVKSIGTEAFYNCDSITSVTIPNSVTSIGSSAFSACTSLTIYCEAESKPSSWNSGWKSSSIPVVWNCKNNEVADDGYIYTVIDGVRYSLKDNIATVVEQPRNITEANILASITYKGVSYSVTSIVKEAFYNCRSLTNVTIGNSVTSIGNYAFYNCFSLTSVTIGNSVTSIGYEAFKNCSSLTSVTFEEGSQLTSIGGYAFYDCTSLTSITIPNSVTSIGYEAFEYCTSLTSVTIPNSVTSIGYMAFAYCDSLTSITVDKDNTVYCDIDGNLYTKDGKTLIQYAIGKKDTNFTIPNGVTSIGSSAFRDCTSLTSVTIPNSVTSIGYQAFYGCSLTSVTFENPDGWRRSTSSTATSGTSIAKADLQNTSTAAEYLSSTYYGYYWKRS